MLDAIFLIALITILLVLFVKFIFSFIEPSDLFNSSYKEIYREKFKEFEIEDIDVLREKCAVTQAEKDKSFSVTIVATIFLAIINKIEIIKTDTQGIYFGIFLSILFIILSVCTKSIVISSLKNSAIRDILTRIKENTDKKLSVRNHNMTGEDTIGEGKKNNPKTKNNPKFDNNKSKRYRIYFFRMLFFVSVLSLCLGVEILPAILDMIYSLNYISLWSDWGVLIMSVYALHSLNKRDVI